MSKFKFLHVGCGSKRKDKTTPVFSGNEWEEVTLDIDPKCTPDIIGSMTDLSMIEDNSYDAVYSSHNIEHLYIHETMIAVKEFKRILKDDGYVMLVCPDLISTCKALIKDGPYKPLYYLDKDSWVSPIDILYGWRSALAREQFYMAHNSGFTEGSLRQLFFEAGFKKVISTTRERFFDINLMAFKDDINSEEEYKNLLTNHLS